MHLRAAKFIRAHGISFTRGERNSFVCGEVDVAQIVVVERRLVQRFSARRGRDRFAYTPEP
jgi:hypothetical protein